MSSFANLKRQSQSGNLDKLSAKIKELNSSSENSDKSEKFWRPEVDKSGNGMATIRFLPAPAVDGEDALPWVKLFSHGFQGPGGWLIDNCLTTKGQPCPVCEENNKLWNTGIEANKNIVRSRKRKLNYIANVYIVSDPKHPENDGTIKLFKFGKKIFDKITEAMNPQFEDEKAINPFDMWTGANFKLKIRKVEGYQNYDKSEFESAAPLLSDDGELEKIWKSESSLSEQIADKEFKSYDQIKNRLEKVLGTSSPKTTVETIKADAPKLKAVEQVEAIVSSTEEDDDMSYFSKLAEEE
jgi:hypothetical protein